MYVRDTQVIVMRPGIRGNDHASERFGLGGSPENDLIGRGDELRLWRIVTPQRMPEAVVAAMAGRRLGEVLAIPAWKGFDPRRGEDRAGDWLSDLGDAVIAYARHVERGTLIALDEREYPLRGG